MIQLFKPHVTEDAIAAVGEVLRSGWIGLGPRTGAFEEAFAAYVGAPHAVAVNSATAALHLALAVAGVGPGDEVLTTALTFVSSNHAILYQGAAPVFVDVDDRTLNMDLDQAAELVSPRTRALVAVHYGGNPLPMERLYAFARRHGLAVVEDAAHACGATYGGRRVGSFGLSCFSFHAVKNLPTGDGGMITTGNPATYEHLQRLRWMGIDRSTFARAAGTYQWEYDVVEAGFKYHMNDITAAIGLAHLPHVDAWNARRHEIVAIYHEELGDLEPERLRWVETTPGAVSARHLCAVRVPDRDAVVDALRARDIGVGVHYKPSHFYPMYAGARRGDLAVTEQAYRELLSLPLHLGLTDADARTVARSLRVILTAHRPAVGVAG